MFAAIVQAAFPRYSEKVGAEEGHTIAKWTQQCITFRAVQPPRKVPNGTRFTRYGTPGWLMPSKFTYRINPPKLRLYSAATHTSGFSILTTTTTKASSRPDDTLVVQLYIIEERSLIFYRLPAI